MRVSLIAAISTNNVIGVKNTLPWHISQDLRWFRMNTMHGICIMGRKTWDSLPKKPLKHRINIIISRSERENTEEDVYWVTSVRMALDLAQRFNKANTYIIGGSDIFHQALLLQCVHQIILTRVNVNIYERSAKYLVLPEKKKKSWSSKTFRNNKYSWSFEIYKLKDAF